MHLLSLEAIEKAYPEVSVLEGASMGIAFGQHIGVIGRNGSGKSTLLRIIAGSEDIDGGRIVRPPGLRVRALDQDPRFAQGATVQDVVGDDRAAIAMADRLGLTDPEKPVAQLSGGQRKRLALAVTLAGECDILVLDEPTNHLDVDVIEWLEDHLVGRSSAVVLVTHDRYLLDRVAGRIVEVHRGRLVSHQSGYSRYLENKTEREERDATIEHRRRQRLRTELAWLRRRPKARTGKARYRVDRARELTAEKTPVTPPDLTIDLPARRIGSKIVRLHNAGKRFGDRWVLRGVDVALQADARIGVVGPNGSGKTTLLGLIAGMLEPDEGKVTTGVTVAPGWFGQDPREIPHSMRLLAVVRERAEVTKTESGLTVSASQLLERFQFDGEAQRSTVGDLSGGERRRLELLLVLMEAPNLLLLDEPTNDLDLDTLNVLEEYLDAWPGALVTASHDRYFLDRVCRDIYSIEPDGTVLHHPGGWSAYRTAVDEAPRKTSQHVVPSMSMRPEPLKTRLSFEENREVRRLGSLIPELEARRDELSSSLEGVGSDYVEAERVSAQLDAVLDELDAAETRWLELTEESERLRRSPPDDPGRSLGT